MAKKKAAKTVAEEPVAAPAVPDADVSPDAIWIEDKGLLRAILGRGNGDKSYTVNVNGRVYHHTRERPNGDWVYSPTRMK